MVTVVNRLNLATKDEVGEPEGQGRRTFGQDWPRARNQYRHLTTQQASGKNEAISSFLFANVRSVLD